ncbi:serine-rich adhesin for platelets-like [Schistocerca gregaria]|uniref:serine-rich adhesin for platelets-like n=1 Tax=Schistocerca gregaria TaxID=7010 RepID=UPI00211DDC43|nr:serine-rich adhesin for platelets-like [Schistocerca gregaria]
MPAGVGRRSRSGSPLCGCCGDREGDGARRRRRRPRGRRTVSCGCEHDDAADDAEDGSRRYWTGSPPRTPPDWRDSFLRLRRRWSDVARRRSRRRGSQDRARPANPSPGEIRAMTGRNRPGAQPEYAASGPDPAPWTREGQAAAEPTREQREAQLRRWQEATLRVSVEAVEPTSGSRFSIAACWDPDSTPHATVSSTGSDRPALRGRARTLPIGPPAAGHRDDEESLESSSASSSLSGSSSPSDDESGTEEIDEEAVLGDPLEQVWEEVDDVLQNKPIDRDETRAEVESILRASALSEGEKLAVINAALEESAKDPVERRATAKSMLRRATRSAREVTDTDDLETEASGSQDRRASGVRHSARGSKVHSLVEEFEEGPRASASRRTTEARPKKSIMRRDQRRSTRMGDDGEDRQAKRTIRWFKGSTSGLPVESRKSGTRSSAVGGRRTEQRQSQAPRKSGLSQQFGSIFGKSFSTAPKSTYRESRLAPRPSQRRSTRRSTSGRADSSVFGRKRSSATGVVSDEEPAAYWSMEAISGSHSSSADSDDYESEEATRPRHSSGSGERKSTARRASEAPRQSESRRSSAARSVYHEDEEPPPLKSISTRRPTGWPRRKSRSSSVDTEADERTSSRRSVDDAPRHSQRRSSRGSTHRELPEARESRAESRRTSGRVSNVEESGSEGDTKRSSSRSSQIEEGDPVERRRWSSRRRDDEDDDEGGGSNGIGAFLASPSHSGRKSSTRRTVSNDSEQSSQPRRKSSRQGTEEHHSEADCCCVGGDHASSPSLKPSVESRPCECVSGVRSVGDQVASSSDFCCCRCRAERKAAQHPRIGDGSGSEECSCPSHEDVDNALPAVARDTTQSEYNCYCGEPRAKATARADAVKKQDLEVELYCECLGEEETLPPAKDGNIKSRREVCPAAVPSVPVTCKAALEDWTCLCDRPLSRKKKAAGKTAPTVQQRRWTWQRVLLRCVPGLVAVLLWLLCVWWLCGMLRPLFCAERRRRGVCTPVYWAS